MAQQTSIGWTATVNPDGSVSKGHVWNPISGCTRVSAGCDNCYAMHFANRFSGVPGHAMEGLTVIRQGKVDWSGKIKLNEQQLLAPLRRKKPTRYFVNSMSDLFHHNVPDEYIRACFGIMSLCGQHTFQILTKRPDRMKEFFDNPANSLGSCQVAYLEYFEESLTPTGRSRVRDTSAINGAVRDGHGTNAWPLPNVWLGVSVEDQKTADERIPLLLQTPAAVRWISAEPLIGPIDLGWRNLDHNFALNLISGEWQSDTGQNPFRKLDWVVVGGESGAGARPIHPDWVRAIRDQCTAAYVPFFFKQWGAWRQTQNPNLKKSNEGQQVCIHRDGHRQWCPSHQAFATMERVGKKFSGRELDGRTWDEFPKMEVAAC